MSEAPGHPAASRPPRAPISRRQAGQAAEACARDYLQAHGRRIVCENWLCPRGELDLVAWHGTVLTFVEVRSRAHAHVAHPLHTIDARKRQRLWRAAQDYLAKGHTGPWPQKMRFDVVALVGSPPRPEVTLVEEAFVVGE